MTEVSASGSFSNLSEGPQTGSSPTRYEPATGVSSPLALLFQVSPERVEVGEVRTTDNQSGNRLLAKFDRERSKLQGTQSFRKIAGESVTLPP